MTHRLPSELIHLEFKTNTEKILFNYRVITRYLELVDTDKQREEAILEWYRKEVKKDD